MLENMKIAFIGSGVMGEAMIKGLLNRGLTTADRISASDPGSNGSTTSTPPTASRCRPTTAPRCDAGVVVLLLSAAVAAQGRHLHSKSIPMRWC